MVGGWLWCKLKLLMIDKKNIMSNSLIQTLPDAMEAHKK